MKITKVVVKKDASHPPILADRTYEASDRLEFDFGRGGIKFMHAEWDEVIVVPYEAVKQYRLAREE